MPLLSYVFKLKHNKIHFNASYDKKKKRERDTTNFIAINMILLVWQFPGKWSSFKDGACIFRMTEIRDILKA